MPGFSLEKWILVSCEPNQTDDNEIAKSVILLIAQDITAF
jgi:hypothetical protein